MDKLVYLAGGMEYVQDGKSWREEAETKLKAVGYSSWNPYKEETQVFNNKKIQEFVKNGDKLLQFTQFRDIMRKLIKLDLGTIKDDADVVLVKFDASTLKGAGTKAEISVATLFNKPVHVWLDGLSLREIPSWCLGSFNTVSSTLDEAIERLKDYEEQVA